MGRKKSPDPRNCVLRIRLTAKEYARLEDLCENGITLSAAVRACINESSGQGSREKEYPAWLRGELVSLRREMSAIGRNINQIVKANNSGFYSGDDKKDLSRSLAAVLEAYQRLLKKLQEAKDGDIDH